MQEWESGQLVYYPICTYHGINKRAVIIYMTLWADWNTLWFRQIETKTMRQFTWESITLQEACWCSWTNGLCYWSEGKPAGHRDKLIKVFLCCGECGAYSLVYVNSYNSVEAGNVYSVSCYVYNKGCYISITTDLHLQRMQVQLLNLRDIVTPSKLTLCFIW
jgi:hypothetical protein